MHYMIETIESTCRHCNQPIFLTAEENWSEFGVGDDLLDCPEALFFHEPVREVVDPGKLPPEVELAIGVLKRLAWDGAGDDWSNQFLASRSETMIMREIVHLQHRVAKLNGIIDGMLADG